MMDTNARFWSTGTTSDFVTKYFQYYMNNKTFEKINIKIVMSIQQYTLVRYFSHFVELEITRPDLPKKV